MPSRSKSGKRRPALAEPGFPEVAAPAANHDSFPATGAIENRRRGGWQTTRHSGRTPGASGPRWSPKPLDHHGANPTPPIDPRLRPPASGRQKKTLPRAHGAPGPPQIHVARWAVRTRKAAPTAFERPTVQ